MQGSLTKDKYKETLDLDLQRYNGMKPSIKEWLFNYESWYLYQYVRNLRSIEYHANKGGYHRFLYLFHYFIHKRLSLRFHITIYPFTTEGGLRLYHIGDFTHIGHNCIIGKNCTILPGVVFGNKHEEESKGNIIIGDNCYFGLGAKIFGSVRIGNNVTVGANSIVTKDIPDNAIVGGVPAKIIKFKE